MWEWSKKLSVKDVITYNSPKNYQLLDPIYFTIGDVKFNC